MIFLAWLIVDSANEVVGLDEIVALGTTHAEAVDLVRRAWRIHSDTYDLKLPEIDDKVIAVVEGHVGDVWVNGHRWQLAESRARL